MSRARAAKSTRRDARRRRAGRRGELRARGTLYL